MCAYPQIYTCLSKVHTYNNQPIFFLLYHAPYALPCFPALAFFVVPPPTSNQGPGGDPRRGGCGRVPPPIVRRDGGHAAASGGRGRRPTPVRRQEGEDGKPELDTATTAGARKERRKIRTGKAPGSGGIRLWRRWQRWRRRSLLLIRGCWRLCCCLEAKYLGVAVWAFRQNTMFLQNSTQLEVIGGSRTVLRFFVHSQLRRRL